MGGKIPPPGAVSSVALAGMYWRACHRPRGMQAMRRAMTETRPHDDVAAIRGILENLYGDLDGSGEGTRA